MSAPKFKAGDVVQVPREIDTRTITARGDFYYLYRSTNAAGTEWLIDADWLDVHGTLVEPVIVVDVLYLYRYADHKLWATRTSIIHDYEHLATVTSYSDGTVRYEIVPDDCLAYECPVLAAMEEITP